MKLETRIFVLEFALKIEESVTELLLSYLNIQNERRKASTNKNGSLSFKNRIDILFDIDVLSTEDYINFLLLMEFRNQFMHNIECETFSDAFKLLGSDKENKLLKFNKSNNETNAEEASKNAFLNLFRHLRQIVKEKMLIQQDVQQNNSEIFFKTFSIASRMTDDLFFFLMKRFGEEIKKNENVKLSEVRSYFLGEIKEFIRTHSHQKLLNKMKELDSEENSSLYDEFILKRDKKNIIKESKIN